MFGKEQYLISKRYLLQKSFKTNREVATFYFAAKSFDSDIVIRRYYVALQRHSLSVLRGVCIDCEYRVLVVQLGILNTIILMARSKKVITLREVVSALSYLSSFIEYYLISN